MFAALSVGEVGAIVLVDGEAETALEGADVVFEEVGIFVQVDCFEGEFAETFSPVSVGCAMGCYSSAAELGASSVLVVRMSVAVAFHEWMKLLPGNPC